MRHARWAQMAEDSLEPHKPAALPSNLRASRLLASISRKIQGLALDDGNDSGGEYVTPVSATVECLNHKQHWNI